MASPADTASTQRRSDLLEQTLRRHRSVLLAQARRHCSRPADAEEALQDACLAFLRSFEGEAGDHAIAYLMLSVKRCAWAISKRASRRREAGFEDFTRATDGEPFDLAAVLPDPAPMPLERTLERELTSERRHSISELKPDERTALLMFASGCSYAEIAERRGWTRTKVNRCINEGRAALRQRANRAPAH